MHGRKGIGWRSPRAIFGAWSALVLLACGERVDSTASNEPAGSVEIRVLDEVGQPVARTELLVDGRVVTTDALGGAVLSEVPARYDAAVVVAGAAYAFLGLTTRSAVLRLRQSAAAERTSYATVEVDSPEGLGSDQRLFFLAGVSDLAADAQVNYFGVTDAGRYVLTTWPGSAGVVLSTQAIIAELDPEARSVIGYSGYAAETWQLAPDDYARWGPIFAPVPFDTVPIHADIDVDAGRVTFASTVSESAGLVGESAFATDVARADLPVLDVPGARYDVMARVAQAGGMFVAEERDVEAGASVTLRTAPAPAALAPADGATIDLDTAFDWTAADGAVYRLGIYADDGAEPFFQYDIATDAAEVRLPDLAPLGFAFPAGRKLVWNVRAELGHASVDSYAAGERSYGQGFTNSRLATGASP
jgi:hypothetical protein